MFLSTKNTSIDYGVGETWSHDRAWCYSVLVDRSNEFDFRRPTEIMSALNLRHVKRDFSELNYRPDVCHPDLIDELLTILYITGK